MSGLFKFVLYLGVALGLAAYAMPYIDHPMLRELPAESRTYLSYAGLGLIILGFVGRLFTKKETVTWE